MSHSRILLVQRLILRNGTTMEYKGSGKSTVNMFFRCYHRSPLNQKSSEDVTKAKELHQQMKEVLGPKRAPLATTETDKVRKASLRQSVINVGISFMTVVLAGQALKSGSERRKMEKKMYDALQETEEKIKLLKYISSETVLRDLAQKICNEALVSNSVPESSSHNWFGFIKSDVTTNSSVEDRIYEVLRAELSARIGDADQSAAERDRSHLEKLQQEEILAVNQILNEPNKSEEIQIERVGEDETVIKKRVFRM